MSTISCDNMSFHYDDPFCEVFSSLSIGIDTAWRCAVVGRNGRGKTTLLDLIRGRCRPSRGQLSVPCEVCHFPTRPTKLERPTLQVIKDAVAPFARWEKEMARLTLKGDDKSLARYGEIAETFAEKGGYEIEAAISSHRRTDQPSRSGRADVSSGVPGEETGVHACFTRSALAGRLRGSHSID